MPEYLVIWEIDIEADTPRDAALEALEIQRNIGSEATVFKVKEKGTFGKHDGEEVIIDLLEE